MSVPREVILDLLPVYLAGEASPATRLLVEEFLAQDAELSRRVRSQWTENLGASAPTALPPELELRSLRRTRRLLVTLRWLFGCGIAFTAVAFSFEVTFRNGRIETLHPLLMEYPGQFFLLLLMGAGFWTAYYLLRRRLRTGPR